MKLHCLLALVFVLVHSGAASCAEIGEDGFANSSGVKIHYVTLGKGPLVVLLHGFPDYWYTWRDQMPALAQHFQVVAVDLRGYNLSDHPKASKTTHSISSWKMWLP